MKRSISIEFPLSSRRAAMRYKHIAIGIGFSFLAFVLFCGGIVGMASGADSAVLLIGLMLIAAVFIPGGFIYAVLNGRTVVATFIDESEQYVWLRGAQPDFLRTLPVWRG